MADPEPPPDRPLRVLVVDADDRVRESLTRLLEIGDRLLVVGNAGSADEAFDLVRAAAPDLVMVDPRLPEVEVGLAFIARLRAASPAIRILAMSWSDTLEPTALAGGADGFVRKTFRPADLVAAIVATGGRTDAA
jgi:two-component system, NarL family, response regulator DevR